jgi:hypothetical protein
MIIPIKKLILENNFGLQSNLATVLGESFKKYGNTNKTYTLSKGMTKLPQKANNQSNEGSEIYNPNGSIKDNYNSSFGDS